MNRRASRVLLSSVTAAIVSARAAALTPLVGGARRRLPDRQRRAKAIRQNRRQRQSRDPGVLPGMRLHAVPAGFCPAGSGGYPGRYPRRSELVSPGGGHFCSECPAVGPHEPGPSEVSYLSAGTSIQDACLTPCVRAWPEMNSSKSMSYQNSVIPAKAGTQGRKCSDGGPGPPFHGGDGNLSKLAASFRVRHSEPGQE